jgi:hypothetical protein
LRVNVKLFGLLPSGFPDYDPELGIDVELPHQATVSDLLSYLKIEAGIAIVNHLARKPDDGLNEGECVSLFMAAPGG